MRMTSENQPPVMHKNKVEGLLQIIDHGQQAVSVVHLRRVVDPAL